MIQLRVLRRLVTALQITEPAMTMSISGARLPESVLAFSDVEAPLKP